MNNLFTKLLLILVCMTFITTISFSQVEIGSNTYSTLKAGFDAINAGTHTGSIVVKITNNTTESSTAVLNASGNGSASYSSVTIYPTGSYTISGSIASSGIIELRGADNVTIDGRVSQSGTTRALTIKNTYTSTSAVIWLDSLTSGTGGAATNNKITYCNIVGGTTTSSCYAICIGASSSLTTGGAGNDNNEISYCSITKAYNAIRSYGVSTSAVNKNLKIIGNTIGSTTSSETVTYQGIYDYYSYGTQITDNIFESFVYTSTIYAIYSYYTDYTKIANNEFRNFQNASTMYLCYLYYSNYLDVKNNVVKNFNGTSSQYIFYTVSSNYGNFQNNKIENLKTTNGAMYGFYFSSCPYLNVENNSIKNVVCTSTNYLLYMSSSANSYVKNNIWDNVYNSGSVIYAYYLTSCGTTEVTGNTAKNLNMLSTFYGVYLGSSTYSKANNNTFDNVTVNNSSGYGIYLTSSGYSEIKNNVINNLTCFNYAYGIYNSTGTDIPIMNNIVSQLTGNGGSGTATGAIGINVLGTSNNQLIINNSVSYMRSTNYTNSNGVTNPWGIRIEGGTGHKIYYNSVNLSGTQINQGTSSSMSAAFIITTTSVNNIDVRNNVFANTLTGVSGSKMYAIYLAGSGNLTNSTFNYNNYYVSGSQNFTGYYTSDRANLAAWKSAINQDGNSGDLNPVFNSYYNTCPFPGSQLPGKGTPLTSYTTDIMNNSRSTTAPTPGAYENAADILGPDITFTPLQTTTSTSNRTLVVTITDFTGVNTTTSAPRLYYKKTTNANTYNSNTNSTDGWKYVTPSINGSDYTFTIDYGKVYGGTAVGDFIEYFVIAQDVAAAGNISIAKGKFTNQPTNTSLVANNFPFTSDYNYGIAQSVSGTYSVGSGNTYTTLTAAGGLFEYLNKGVQTGDITIKITGDISTEDGAFELKNLPMEGGTSYKINIVPSTNAARKLTGSNTAAALFRFIGTNNLNIDGSYEGSGKYLEFSNTATSGTRAVIMLGSGGAAINGGKNCTIQNCKIYNGANATTSFGIIISDGSVSTAATSVNVNNLTIKNNDIYKSQYGIMARGTTAGFMLNLLIEGNTVGSDNSTDYILQYGIDVQNAPNGLIRKNKVYNIINTTSSGMRGIQIGGSPNVPTIVEGNWIYSLKYNGTGGWGSFGIDIIAGTPIIVRNNFISDISTDRYSNSSTSYNPFAIRIAGGSGHKIWHNTVNMYGSQGGTNTTASLTANILYASLYSNMDIRGNMLHNSLTGVSGTNSFNIFLYTTSAITSAFALLDNNSYSISGSDAAVGGYGTAVPFTEAADLQAWQKMTGRDASSVSQKPTWISDYDVHLAGGMVGNSSFMFNRLVDVTTDGDGENRNASTYYGADELNPVFEITKNTTLSPSQAVYCYGETIDFSVKSEITKWGDGISRSGAPPIYYQWYKNGEPMWENSTEKFTLKNIKQSDSAKYSAKTYFMSTVLDFNTVNVIVEGPIVITKNIGGDADVCSTQPSLDLAVDATGILYGYQWEKYDNNAGQWADMKGESNKVLGIPLANPEQAIGSYRARIMGPGNCGPAVVYSGVTNVRVTEPVVNMKSWSDQNLHSVCKGETMVMKASAEGTVYGYRWQYSGGAGFVDLSLEEFPSAATPELIVENALPNQSGQYRCVFLGSAACNSARVPSAPLDVVVYPFFEISEHPIEQIVCKGDDIFLNVYAEGLIYGYQWYKDGKKLTLEDNKYAKSQIFMIDKADYANSGLYHCVLTIEDCSGIKEVPSKPAAVYVCTQTDITKDPETQGASLGGTAIFTTRAHVNGAPKDYRLPIQWYRGDEPIVDDGVRIQGAKSQILMIKNVQETDYGMDYRVVVTGLCGTAEVKDFGIVKVEVNITEHPKSQALCEKTMAVFNVTAVSSIGQANITYQWFKDGVALYDDVRIAGTTTNKLVISNINDLDAGEYYVRVGLKDASNYATSLPAELTIKKLPELTVDLEDELTVKTDGTFTLYIVAAGENNRYQWYFNDYRIPEANDDTYTVDVAAPENAGSYYIEVTNDCGTIKSNVTNVIVTTTTTDVTMTEQDGFRLFKPNPHPVNGAAELNFTVPFATDVEIAVYDINGTKVADLFNGNAAQGNNRVAINTNNMNIASGTYVIIMKSNRIKLNQTITIVK